ncbi:MAG: dihydroorotate dehydrogenase electron transfer subunit [Ruminococcus sp.]|nr:dihydroorotate dehydrogenase electron transfer subunit [Ruminococcus sp.]
MKYTQGKYPLIKKESIAKEVYSFTILCPEVAEITKAGQFVHILPKGYTLRRPISICGIDKAKGTLRIVFEVRGDGTKELSETHTGELIDMIAPLGNGFTLSDDIKKIILIGGGIGTPPMLPLAQEFGENAIVITGFRNSSAVILQEDFKKTGAKTILCTDDGSTGIHGLVTAPLEEVLKSESVDLICACGPTPMLKAISNMADTFNVECQVSLEERMGCGIGACLVCACKVQKDGQEQMLHVCKDGPVFKSKEVVW